MFDRVVMNVIHVPPPIFVIVDGVSGVEVQTEEAWRYAEEFDLPRLLIVNKLDRENASLSRLAMPPRSRAW